MRLLVVTVALASIGLCGCADPTRIRLAAEREAFKAKQLDAVGDRYGADKASAASWKQYQKANTRNSHHMAEARLCP